MRGGVAAVVLVSVLASRGGGQSVTYSVSATWSGGFQAQVTLTAGPAGLAGWAFEFDYPNTIGSVWDGVHADLGGGRHRVSDAGWNASVPAGGSVSFGFVASGTPQGAPSAGCLGGAPVPVNGIPSTGSCVPPPPPPPPAPHVAPPNRSGKRVVGYFIAWGVYGRNYHVPDIPADHVTHVNYAFANLDANGNVLLGDPYADTQLFYPGDDPSPGALRGSFNQLLRLKERHPHLKTLISIGGWTWSTHFSTVAATAGGRSTFASSAVSFMKTYGFDGIDIDWEYPVSGGLASNATSPADAQNYTLLLQEVRAQLDAQAAADGRPYLLTIAGPAGPSTLTNVQLGAIHPYLDWINLMSYDFHGSWSNYTHFNAPLRAVPGDPNPPSISAGFNVEAAVQAYLAAGVPPGKLHLGLPFYGRGFANVANTGNGLFQAFSGVPAGTWEAGVFDYEDLLSGYLPTFTQHRHPVAEVPWLHDPASGVMISYDDPLSLTAKLDYALSQGLGGAMYWEFSGDDAAATLARTVSGRLLDPAPWLALRTSGSGVGDLDLRVYGLPSAASHCLLAVSQTPSPAGPGTGPLLGLTPDPLTTSVLLSAPSAGSALHFPVGGSPYASGPLTLPAGAFAAFAGTTWECLAIAYQAQPLQLIGASGVAPVTW